MPKKRNGRVPPPAKMFVKEPDHMPQITFSVYTFKQREIYVAYVSGLDVSTCGTTAGETRTNIRDAVGGSLEASRDPGTLSEILEEAGYVREGDTWRGPEFVSLGRATARVE